MKTVQRQALAAALSHRQLAQVAVRSALEELRATPQTHRRGAGEQLERQLQAVAQLLALPLPEPEPGDSAADISNAAKEHSRRIGALMAEAQRPAEHEPPSPQHLCQALGWRR
jgi:hypothetical protein